MALRLSRTTAIGAGLAAVVLAVSVAAVIGFGGGDPQPDPGIMPPATAQVTKSTLVQTEKVSGTLSYGAAKPLLAKGSGTVTWLPAEGTTIKLGQPVYQVDGQPVVLVHGTMPPFRTLEPGVDGQDVKQLEETLKTLGYAGFSVDSEYSWQTAAAVRKWQKDLGLEQTGSVTAGQIVVAPGDLRVAAHTTAVGAALKADQPVLSATGTIRVVTVALDVAKQHLVAQGIKATITLPDGKPADGAVSAIGSVATAAENGPATITVTISIAEQSALGTLDAAPVSVTLAANKRENVLTVPIAALVALTEGGYGVQVIDGTATRYVAVETGMFANGRVEITGAGIAEGTTVGVPSS